MPSRRGHIEPVTNETNQIRRPELRVVRAPLLVLRVAHARHLRLMKTPAIIVPATAIEQNELDDAQAIAELFASNTREHLITERNIRNGYRPLRKNEQPNRLSEYFAN